MRHEPRTPSRSQVRELEMEPQNDELNRVGLEQRDAPGRWSRDGEPQANRGRRAIASSGSRRPAASRRSGPYASRRSTGPTTSAGGSTGWSQSAEAPQSFVLGQNVMAIGLRERGGLVLALAKQLAFYEPGGELELLMEVEQDQPRNRFNDGKVDRRGRYWAGTMNDIDWDKPSGSLYRLDPDLELSRLQGAVVCANGLGWSPDDQTFYLGESFRYAIFAYDFDPDAGTLSARRAFATVDGSSGAFPDGLTVDAEGGVWSVQNGAGRVVRYAADGAVSHEVDVPFPSRRAASSADGSWTSSTSPPRGRT